ncbi:dienelactone hydrolase family protein [Aestuariibacter halophilus]|uniref:Dienelactone hydrolase family protein n=1 Tax=Fluctibacter halophilus TaxID=226011 RepID=A0ABS8GAZ6_9ALTE|nr:dienelactone hydrolase family protein [Aestuariibacter halophilus]MCC2617678.1 dienelactone hydrolase family protein [Aestuariibacter halophilus]
MLGRIVSVLCLLWLAPGWAAVTETPVTLPNDLGTAVVYSNSDAASPGVGMIVVHEWWGLNDYARERARMLAELGHTAIAVDMYGHGKVAEHPDNAKGFMQAAFNDPDTMNARFNAAKAILLENPNVDKERVYAMGYCFGGAVVLNQARMGNDLAGVASFHGSLGSQLVAEKGKVKARILVAHGGADPFVPHEQVSAFMQEMLDAGVDLQFRNYPEAKHSFTNPGADEKGSKYNMPLEYNAEADNDSWQALLAFIDE